MISQQLLERVRLNQLWEDSGKPKGEPPSGDDLDFSGANLDGLELCGAFTGAAVFNGSSLRGAEFAYTALVAA